MDHDAAVAALRQSQLPRILLIPDVASAFGVTDATARRYCRDLLPASQVGGKWVVLRDDLLVWLSERAAQRTPPTDGASLHVVTGGGR